MPRFFEEATYRLYRYYLEDEPTDTPLFWILTIILMAKDFVVQILRTGRLEIRSLREEADHFHQIQQTMLLAQLREFVIIDGLDLDLDLVLGGPSEVFGHSLEEVT